MPATEKTWRDQKLLHLVFGITSVLLLISTMWMFARDNNRPWKSYQKTMRNVETRMTSMRELQEFADNAVAKRTRIENELNAALAQPAPTAEVASFQTLLQAQDPEARTLGLDEDAERQRELGTVALQKWEQYQAALAAAETAKQAADAAEQSAKEAVDAAADAAALQAAEQARQAANDLRERARAEVEAATQMQADWSQAQAKAEAARDALIDSMNGYVKAARDLEDRLLKDRKDASAMLDELRAKSGLAVRDGQEEALAQWEEKAKEQKAEVDRRDALYRNAAEQRQALAAVVGKIQSDVTAKKKELDQALAALKTLETSQVERRSHFFEGIFPGKRWLELPILDAFNSPLKIDNLWSEGLTQDYNFRKVRRFDRCTTCHQSIDKTAPGGAIDPAYPHSKLADFVLVTSTDTKDTVAAQDQVLTPVSLTDAANTVDDRVFEAYGLKFAHDGLLSVDDVTVSYVKPASLGARANPQESTQPLPAEVILEKVMTNGLHRPQDIPPGLVVGDVIIAIDGDPVYQRDRALFRLQDAINRGAPLRLTIQRGLPNPYASHPRLDLFVGSLSPHAKATFACSVCHEGQGSATEFKWVSHTPDSRADRERWEKEHGWFDNHHWIYPMFSTRFAESSCLKCHHNVTELEASERFPEAPAAKVTRGHALFTKYGCYGCHEVNGYDGPDRRVGPDARLEPNYSSAALALKVDPGFAKLDPQQQQWIEQLIGDPSRNDTRHRLLTLLEEDAAAKPPVFQPHIHEKIVPLLKDLDAPGSYRKVGPSLRSVKSKDDIAFLFDWITAPKHFRPSSRMPQIFGLWKHLQAEPEQLELAKQLEPLEVYGSAYYLLQRSQPYEYLTPPEGMTASAPEEKIARGRVLFQERGCLACHAHGDFPDAVAYHPADEPMQGPDLTHLGSKFDPARNPDGRKWLYSWIKEPSRYNPRTLMPHLFLDPITGKDAEGNVTVIDPADDIVAYLMSHQSASWQPIPFTLGPDETAALDRITLEHLGDAYYHKKAEKYLAEGIPESERQELKGAEIELATAAGQPLTVQQKLLYVGRKTIAKQGCYACHDIPGFEDAKPIGTAMADWGRKDPSKLAFEHILNYLHDDAGHGPGVAPGDHSEQEHYDGLAPGAEALPDYFEDQLNMGNRIGFIYQKLREPRSYDYRKTADKKYNERLRMPLFPFSHEEREAVITFVLGLVADPPEPKYVYHPDARQLALQQGQQVLEKYACQTCHIIQPERWTLEARPGEIAEPSFNPDYPFVLPEFSGMQIAASRATNRRGDITADLVGMPFLTDQRGQPRILVEDDGLFEIEQDGQYDPAQLYYQFSPWQSQLIDGHPIRVGGPELVFPDRQVSQRWPAWGGYLAKYLVPRVAQRELKVNPNQKAREAWGWVPPMLMGEGAKVQAEWLHDFLLEPHVIRPAAVLRMPRFNMSSDEAAKLVNFFAARDNAAYPFKLSERRQEARVAAANAEYAARVGQTESPGAGEASVRFQDAMKIVTSSNYCVKCHLVGDFVPVATDRAKAPNLAVVYQRLQADYIRRWIGSPTSILPYTSMPVNVIYDPSKPFLGSTVSQDLYHGNSIEQVDALVDLLMNYDMYAKQRSSIAPLVQAATPASPNATDAGATAPAPEAQQP